MNNLHDLDQERDRRTEKVGGGGRMEIGRKKKREGEGSRKRWRE